MTLNGKADSVMYWSIHIMFLIMLCCEYPDISFLSSGPEYTLKNKGYLLGLMVPWRTFLTSTEPFHCKKGCFFLVEKGSLDY